MDGVGISIIGRPRPLPGHDTPNALTPPLHPQMRRARLVARTGPTGRKDARVVQFPRLVAMRLRSGRCCGQSADPLGERRPKTTVLAEWVCTLADSLSGVACCPDRFPAAAWPVLLGRAAVCAGGRRPARSPSAPRAALGASSRSPARPSGPSGALHTGGACGAVCGGASSRCPAGPAAASDRSGLVVCV